MMVPKELAERMLDALKAMSERLAALEERVEEGAA
jgi:hypothetical protein